MHLWLKGAHTHKKLCGIWHPEVWISLDLLLLAMDKEKKTREGKKTKGGICKMMSKDSKLFTVIGQKLDQFHENI